jgi:hypothetical protein
MAQGFDYIDDGVHRFEGFSIRLGGGSQSVELVPTGLVYPELGNDSGNIVGIKVVVCANGFCGEYVIDLPLPALFQLRSDLQAWTRDGEKGFTFPSPSQIVYFSPGIVECTIETVPWSIREWRIHSRLSDFRRHDDPNDGSSAFLEVYFQITSEEIEIARGDLDGFLGYLNTMRAQA